MPEPGTLSPSRGRRPDLIRETQPKLFNALGPVTPGTVLECGYRVGARPGPFVHRVGP